MDLAELAETLANGFHDAEIEQLVWNHLTNKASFTMRLWVPEEADSNPEFYRAGRLDLEDIVFIVIDPPYPRTLDSRPYKSEAETLRINGTPTTEGIFPNLPGLMRELPEDVEPYSFYVENWNSFIHIAAKEAHLVWLGEKEIFPRKTSL